MCNDADEETTAVVDQCKHAIFAEWYTACINAIHWRLSSRMFEDTTEFCIIDKDLMLCVNDVTPYDQDVGEMPRIRPQPRDGQMPFHLMRLSKSSLQNKSRLTFSVPEADQRNLTTEILRREIPASCDRVLSLFSTRHTDYLAISRLADGIVRQRGWHGVDYNRPFQKADTFILTL